LDVDLTVFINLPSAPRAVFTLLSSDSTAKSAQWSMLARTIRRTRGSRVDKCRPHTFCTCTVVLVSTLLVRRTVAGRQLAHIFEQSLVCAHIIRSHIVVIIHSANQAMSIQGTSNMKVFGFFRGDENEINK
jgi:hypothetical protein